MTGGVGFLSVVVDSPSPQSDGTWIRFRRLLEVFPSFGVVCLVGKTWEYMGYMMMHQIIIIIIIIIMIVIISNINN